MNLRRLGVVFRKEIVDGLRDRRSLYSVAISVLVGPLLVGFMFSRIAERQNSARDIEIPIVGAQNAPALVDWLRQQEGVSVADGPENAEHAVREQQQDIVVVIPDEFNKQFAEARRAKIQLVADGSRDSARPKVQRVRRLLEMYGAQIATLRLIARGISPAIASPIRIDDIEVSSTQQRAARILGFVPLFIVIAAFAGGMQIATDSTAGERERGSLESLLANPVAREAFVGGKWLAAVVFAVLTMVLTTALCAIVLERMPLQELGIRFRFGREAIAGALAASLPMAFLASSLQIFVASFARSFKEAQSYLSMLILVPMLPGILTIVYPVTNQWWMAPVPVLGQHLLLSDVLGGKDPSTLAFGLAALSAFASSLVLVYLTTRLFRKEKTIFGR
jgi:sodium transport system permease protein